MVAHDSQHEGALARLESSKHLKVKQDNITIYADIS